MIEIIFLFCYYKIKPYLCSVINDPLCPYGHLPPLYGENLQSAVDIKGTDTKANTISNDSMSFPIVILNSFNFVQFANARHSSCKHGSALA